MLKHIGKHNEKKVVLLYRTVPNEDHMCLVAYSDLLPRMMHDEVMKVLETPVGQQAENFADALFRSMLPDGRNALEALHRDGLIKKVQTSQVIVTPTPGAKVRLDELNNILAEMAKGEEAVKRLAELDAQLGMAPNKSTGRKIVENQAAATAKTTAANAAAEALTAPADSVLSDDVIAKNLLSQATRMRVESKGLAEEAARLEKQAKEMTKKNGKKSKAPA